MNQEVSWDGHLCGALAGGLLAYANRRVQSTKLTESKVSCASARTASKLVQFS